MFTLIQLHATLLPTIFSSSSFFFATCRVGKQLPELKKKKKPLPAKEGRRRKV
jgi:hypothetical protein